MLSATPARLGLNALARTQNGDGSRGSEFLFADPEVFLPERLPSLEAIECTIPVLLERLAKVSDTVARWAGRDSYRGRRVAAVRRLVETQELDGHWDGRTVASPYPPTAAAAMALVRAIESEFSADALLAVARAIPGCSRPSGRADPGGVWHPTAEETACAVHALCACANPSAERSVARALRRSHIFLADCYDAATADSTRTPLWHYKDLGSPLRIERLYTLTALLMSGSPLR
ncbi:hypothetical protein [Nocardia sp. NPDC004711]